ncbi:hypothetical protein AMTRI_Chr12g274610 [Amborella trichopoda]|uniref:AP2-like ethylene-responsive transcription factor AIL5 isoform X1 n=1 Tax=Amborella trichopoda TaxID=13333 RepID=UPI0009BF7A78|nr:AP2-like ethylene-responsive transcription factor AIL5 isoform X1 [Amborella trichopoda]|eukprot:XP_020523523.1 AP2-like ethylene-responsive transcription factor AIL5 isoform X1 [Amborella trichopoda]
MDCSNNWLAFSLSSNPPHQTPPEPSPQLCLLEAFNTSGWPKDNTHREEGSGGGDLSMIASAAPPKLEDFLGGAFSGHYSGDFSGNHARKPNTNYDSDLKSIAQGVLQVFPTSQSEVEKSILASDSSTKKSIDTFGQRTSIYRGVTRHRWTGRYEAHLWDNSCRREGQSRKGRQVYLGGYDKEEKAARAYDLAALKYWGPSTTTNFPVSNYEKELEEMKNMTRQEFVASLRRKSSGFSRGASIYRGVTRHHQHGRWQARIGRVAGNKDLYLGTFSTQEEAAEAYDIAAIKFRGLNAVTNFDMSRYDVKSIANSNLPIGGITNKTKASSESSSSDIKTLETKLTDEQELSSLSPQSEPISFAIPIKLDHDWSLMGYQNPSRIEPFHNVSSMTSSAINEAPLTMDFSTNSSTYQSNNCFINGGFTAQQSLPSVTSIDSENGKALYYLYQNPSSLYRSSACENAGYGAWVAPPLPAFPSSKTPGLALCQTPIFGME